MGTMQVLKIGWSRLDAIIDEIGSDGLLAHITWKLSEGVRPGDISGEFDLPWVVLKKWIESDEKRVKEYELGKRAFSDQLAWDSIDEAKNSDIETVALGKYRSDTYMKMAGRLSKKEWGDEKESAAGGITVVVQRGLTAEVEGGVLTISQNENKGNPMPEIPVIEGELVG